MLNLPHLGNSKTPMREVAMLACPTNPVTSPVCTNIAVRLDMEFFS